MKKILCILVLLLVGFLIFLTINKYNYKKDIVETKKTDVGLVEKYEPKIDYMSEYENYVIYDELKSIDYDVITDNAAIYGSVYIGSDKKLYIIDDVNNSKSVILNDAVKTLHNVKNDIGNFCDFYALTVDGKLYYITLFDTNIESVEIIEKKMPVKIKNFTSLYVNSYINSNDDIVVLGEDNNMYSAVNGIRYSSESLNVGNLYIIYKEGFATNIFGNLLINDIGEKYIVKTVLLLNETNNILEHNPNIILITTDNKLVYLVDGDEIYEYLKKVKNVSYTDESIISIVFEDDSEIKFNGYYNPEYYPIE